MGVMAGIVADCGERTIEYTEALLKGIEPATAASFPQGSNGVANINHPVFVLGHLALYPARINAMIAGAPGEAAAPDSYTDLFAPGVECTHDPECAKYPSLDEVSDAYFSAYRSALATIRAADDAVLSSENPAEGRMKELFPLVGHAATFLVTSHAMVHLGQLSAWRRAMGLGSAM